MKLPQDPIFIVGYPRSGTTLLQRILVMQPGIFSFPETHYFCVIEKQLKYDTDGNIQPSCLDMVFQKIQEKIELCFSPAEENHIRCLVAEKKMTSKELFEIITARLLLNINPHINQMTDFRWLEKTPNHAHFLHHIVELYPRAQVLHILRHPVPAIFSRKLKFPFNKDLPVTELAKRWNRMFEDVERFKARFPHYILTLRYEDLLIYLDKEVNNICAFLHIPFDLNTISQLKEPKEKPVDGLILPSETWKLADSRRDMANTNDYYKDKFTGQDVLDIESVVNENMKKYGYESYASGGI
ncbi:MAG: sulfotransferase [Acidobacteria bacterium]|jgi:hypothetical protein|nr:sulfotransferase [Acidobacteriota bacterium]